MSRSFKIVLGEALIIGVINAVFIFLTGKINLKVDGPVLHIISGALIHILFEYLDLNKIWCQKTYLK